MLVGVKPLQQMESAIGMGGGFCEAIGQSQSVDAAVNSFEGQPVRVPGSAAE